MVKPKALPVGSMLGIISPASTPKAESVAAGIAVLQGLGYRTKLFPHALDRGPLYYAGTLEARLADFHAAFADLEVDGVICTRGGWGAAELLPHLDKKLITKHPKAFLGYSDITSLHMWFQRELGLVSFQSPMVSADFAKPGQRAPDPVSWRAAIEGAETWTLGPESGLRVLRAGTGTAKGMLVGGCLSIYVEGLCTPYGPLPLHKGQAGVLFLEDIGTKPYQWDRMLVHLRYAGMFDRVQGIVFGDMHECVEENEMQDLEDALLHATRDFAGPVAIGLKSGHVATRNVTLPFGVEVALDLTDTGNPAMHFLESAVQR